MNILPLIFIFLTILAVTSYSFVQESSASYRALKSYRGFMRAERLARNSLESKRYYAIRISKDPTPKDSSSHTQDRGYESPRRQLPPAEASRLSIALLFSDNPPPFLYETTAKLIKILYGKCAFFIESKIADLEYQIVDQMLLHFHNQAPNSFAELFPEDPQLRSIYYKMLKGTNRYALKSPSGYPPLEDFLTLTPLTGKQILQIPYASESLLQALWGDSIAQAIILAEEKKWEKDRKFHTLLENELTTLLTKVPPNLQLGTLKDYISFSTKRPQLEKKRYTDNASQITLRKPAQS